MGGFRNTGEDPKGIFGEHKIFREASMGMKELYWKVNGVSKVLNYDLLHVDSTEYSYH